MSILSKICVVVVMVTALVAMVITIQLATVEPNYKALYEQQKNDLQLKASEVIAISNAHTHLSEKYEALRKQKQSGEQTLLAEKQALQSDNNQLKLQIAGLKAEIAPFSAQLAALEKGLKAAGERNEALQKSVSDGWTREGKLRQEAILLGEQLKEEQAKSDRLTSTLKAIRVQVEDLRENLSQKNRELADLQKGGAKSDGKGTQEVVATEKIVGTIDAVQNNLASINIGSANGVKENMKLIIYRGSSFVGYLKVEEVRLSSAAGVVMDKQMAPRSGDKVISNLK